MIWHSSETQNVLSELETNAEKGLSNGVADLRLKQYGKNTIKSIETPSLKKHFLRQLNDKSVYVLAVIAIISFIISLIYNKKDFYSPLLIIAIVLINALINAYQLLRSEFALNSLNSIQSPIANVIRDGIEKQIIADELVPGDIIILKSGDYIPADARLIETNNFSCNEYIFSDTDIPVSKRADTICDDISNINDRINMVFSGSIAVLGTAKAVVVETGLNTEIGHNSALHEQSGGDTLPIESTLNSTCKIANISILIICLIVFIISIVQNFGDYGFAETTVTSLLNAMALAVAAIPEGLPAISTVAVALGIERIIKDEIIIKKVKALEVLGKTTVVCSDKTGIITKNSMTVQKIFSDNGFVTLSDEIITEKHKNILRLASSCSTLENDSTEQAIKNACIKYCNVTNEDLDNLFPRVGVIPFDSVRKTMTSIIMIDGKPVAVVKGAPEILADKIKNIDSKALLKANEDMASEAYRVLCIAAKPLDEIPANPSAEIVENDLLFIGLIGIDDPPRANTIEAISTCDKAGIKTVMITGDNLTTAKAVARRVGILKNGMEAISGAELEKMSDDELNSNISKYAVFARISPEDKVRIVNALKNSGEIVTITGDDFKDVSSLAVADIGCAMGRLGNDVARGHADIIIKNSYFDSIISAVKESRGLFANIQKAVAFLLSCNIAEIAFYLIGLIFFKNPPISAVQLLWINLLTDCAPVIALSTGKAEDNVMNERPVALDGRLFDNHTIINIILQSIFITVTSVCAFIIGIKSGDLTLGMTMGFTVLALSQIFHSLNIKNHFTVLKNKFSLNDFFTVSSILIVFIILFLVLTPAGLVFGLCVLRASQTLICLVLSLLIIPFCEVLKIVRKVFDKQ